MIYSIQQYIFQHRTVFIPFIHDFVNFSVFCFFSLFQAHASFSSFPFKKASYFNNDAVNATFLVSSESQAPYASIRILCYQSATAVLKICTRKWLLPFYKLKNVIETSINRSRKASSKRYNRSLSFKFNVCSCVSEYMRIYLGRMGVYVLHFSDILCKF